MKGYNMRDADRNTIMLDGLRRAELGQRDLGEAWDAARRNSKGIAELADAEPDVAHYAFTSGFTALDFADAADSDPLAQQLERVHNAALVDRTRLEEDLDAEISYASADQSRVTLAELNRQIADLENARRWRRLRFATPNLVPDEADLIVTEFEACHLRQMAVARYNAAFPLSVRESLERSGFVTYDAPLKYLTLSGLVYCRAVAGGVIKTSAADLIGGPVLNDISISLDVVPYYVHSAAAWEWCLSWSAKTGLHKAFFQTSDVGGLWVRVQYNNSWVCVFHADEWRVLVFPNFPTTQLVESLVRGYFNNESGRGVLRRLVKEGLVTS